MTAEAIVMLVSLIIEVIIGVDRGTASALANNRNAEITKSSSKLAKEISQDDALVSKLLSAAQNRDADLFQSLINSSPFGSRFKQLKSEYAENKANIKAYQSEAARVQSEGQAAQQEMNKRSADSQTSGSAIWDLISGRATTDTSKPEYERTNLGGNNNA